MISVYLLLDLSPSPAPPPVRPPYSDLPVRFPCPALPGDGMGRKCRPNVW